VLSFKIKNEIANILNSMEDAHYFFECLSKINKTFEQVEKSVNLIASGSDMPNHATTLRNYLASARSKVGEVKPRSFFSSIDKFQTELNKAKECGFNKTSQLNVIDEKISDFTTSYEEYLDGYTPQSAGKMIMESRALESLLYGFKQGLNFYLENIDASFEENENGRELSIVLSSALTLSEFILKLQSIEKIYNELCMLSNVSTEEFPIEILKIESGSLWAKVFGDSKVISLMTSLIESGVSFIYRNYTVEGKITSIPKKVETIESILELKSKLEKQGVDVTELSEHLSKSSIIVVKELNKLISGQAEVIINDNKMSIGNEMQKRLIESNEKLKIELDDESVQ
jgi:hypothetical protein